MDSSAYANSKRKYWKRLETLSKRRSLNGVEIDEFYQLYQSTTADLAFLRSTAPDPDLILHLSAILGRARAKLTATKTPLHTVFLNFFFHTLPYSFYRIRWWSYSISFLFLFLSALVFATYSLNSDLLNSLGTKEDLDFYAQVEFEKYYSQYANSDFSLMVWTNNAWIALQCVAGGVTGIIPLYVLWANSVSLGQAGAILGSRDLLNEFFQLILPHGQLELFAIFIAGAAGLKLFWAWVIPRNLPRSQALATEGKNTVMVGIGLIFVLALSGIIEGYVTPSNLPWSGKILIGTIALISIIFWFSYFGKKAHHSTVENHENIHETGWQIAYT